MRFQEKVKISRTKSKFEEQIEISRKSRNFKKKFRFQEKSRDFKKQSRFQEKVEISDAWYDHFMRATVHHSCARGFPSHPPQ